MKRFEYCDRCGQAVPIFENGLCAKCFTTELDAKRTEPSKPARPVHINSGLSVCEKCGVRAASVRSMCTTCYNRAQRAALSPEQLEITKQKRSAAYKRRRDEKRAAKLASDKLI